MPGRIQANDLMKTPLMNREHIRYNLHLFAEKSVQWRAVKVALLVGTILNIINHPEWAESFTLNEINHFTVFLTFMVPYLVSSWSSVQVNRLTPCNNSLTGSLLKCRSCNKADFRIQNGQLVEECPNCKKSYKVVGKE